MSVILISSLILRLILLPLTKLLSVLGVGQSRWEFESRNLEDAQSQSFRKVGKKADICIHFSSEGEFEQVKTFLEELLIQNHTIELLFTSPSVENKVSSFSKLYGEKVRYLRMPLLDFINQNILHWVTAKKFMMVRYDFFPELLSLGKKMDKFVLYSASSKSSTSKGMAWTFKKNIYQCYSDIFCATSSDYKFFKDNITGLRIHPPLDMRSIQINKRQLDFQSIQGGHFLIKFLENSNYDQRICLAQLWPVEIELFKNQDFVKKIIAGDILVYAAPHKLSAEFGKNILDQIKSFAPDLKIYHFDKETTDKDIEQSLKEFKEEPGLIFSRIPGILCDIYPYFSKVFVGGGHGKGVHSLLEPFVAGSNIFCGPHIHRSTEYDIIKSLGADVTISLDITKIGEALLENQKSSQVDIAEFINHNKLEMKKLIKIMDRMNA